MAGKVVVFLNIFISFISSGRYLRKNIKTLTIKKLYTDRRLHSFLTWKVIVKTALRKHLIIELFS